MKEYRTLLNWSALEAFDEAVAMSLLRPTGSGGRPGEMVERLRPERRHALEGLRASDLNGRRIEPTLFCESKAEQWRRLTGRP